MFPIFGLVLALSVVSQSASSLAIHETVEILPSRWTFVAPAEDHVLLPLQVAVSHSSKDYLDIATAVSDPQSHRYGQYISNTELTALRPNVSADATTIEEWLKQEGAHDVSRHDDWVLFTTTVEDARRIFNADFAWYASERAEPILRTTSYSVPEHLTTKIDFIYPTVHFMEFRRTKPYDLEKRLPPAVVNCTNSLCPSEIKSLYSIGYEPPNNQSSSRIGVAGFLEQYILYDDVSGFLSKYGLRNYTKPYNFTVELINGGLNPQTGYSGAEAALDMQYVTAFTQPLSVTYYSTGGRPPTLSQPGNRTVPKSKSSNEPYLEFLTHLLAEPHPAQVLSISYTDTEQTVPIAYAQRVCNLFAQLATRGVSVIVASGDGGASGTGSDECIAPDGKTKRFLPTFPPSCPWVTSVGAVGSYKPTQPTSYSSGGFSNFFDIPKWQKDAVSGYQTRLGSKLSKYYNVSGRGIPDVSLVGNDYLTYSTGYAVQQKGTSASTPVFAAMITLLNDLRLRKGMPVLGFLNPILYSANVSASFLDVTKGSGGGCSFDDGTSTKGFPALKGWDAATGLGTPNFRKLRMLLT